MSPITTVLGLAIYRESVQAVAVERAQAGSVLHAIDEWKNPLPLDAPQPPAAGFQEFRDTLAAFLKVNRLRCRTACVALDSSLLFLNTIPFLRSATHAHLSSHMGWELRQFYPETPPEDFISDFVKLSPRLDTPHDEYLSVAVRRRHARMIEALLANQDLELETLDADHFSAETALRVNYPDSVRRYLAFAGFKPGRVDVSLIRNGHIESFRYMLSGPAHAPEDAVVTVARETTGLQAIVAYGPSLTKEILLRIRRASPILVEAVNPLRRIQVSDSVRLSDSLHSPPYRFTSAIGSVLRQE